MSTIAVVGAGRGLGRSIARRFAAEGFDVALIGRNRTTLDELVAEMRGGAVRVEGFPADVTDRAGLVAAIGAAERSLGPIEVLEYSPLSSDPSGVNPVNATDVTVESLLPELDLYLFGGTTAVRAVLPGMLDRGRGTILVTTGASSGPVVHPPLGNIAAASAALRNWVLNLHAAVADRGVYAAHVAIAAHIGGGVPEAEPDAIADSYWALHAERTRPELLYQAMPPGRLAALGNGSWRVTSR